MSFRLVLNSQPVGFGSACGLPIPPMSDGRLLNPFADLKALPGSPLSAAFLLKPPVPG